MNPQERIAELTNLLNYYNHQYYQNSVSEVDDFTFDKLLAELTTLETQYPDFRLPDSPTARVGGTISKEFKTVYPPVSRCFPWAIPILKRTSLSSTNAFRKD